MKKARPTQTDGCDRCGTFAEIHYTTDGGYLLCDDCARKMTFDREHPRD